MLNQSSAFLKPPDAQAGWLAGAFSFTMRCMAGYSSTALSQKLGIKEGYAIHTIGAPADYRTLLKPLPDGVRFRAVADATTNLVHLFETDIFGRV